MTPVPSARICEYGWTLYDRYEELSRKRNARPGDVRSAYANYKAHRAICPDCDPIPKVRHSESGEDAESEI